MNPIVLHAGPLRLVFLPDEGAVRWVHYGRREVLRGINAPIRDRGWGTVTPRIEGVVVDQAPTSFRVEFAARGRSEEIDFVWRGTIVGTAEGRLEFAFDGEALDTCVRNRLGFCVLVPDTLAGTVCTVEHGDGTETPLTLPVEIEPHQPAGDIRALRYEIAPGATATLRLEGDEFEMEDQRNWTDASYKLYCTPLARPVPVTLARGTRIRQRVVLEMSGDAAPAPAAHGFPWMAPGSVTVSVTSAALARLPAVGTIWNVTAATEATVEGLRGLDLDHLRLDLDLRDDRHRAVLASGAAAATQLGIGLEIAVHVDERRDEQIAALRNNMQDLVSTARVARWMIFQLGQDCTPVGAVTALREGVRGTAFDAPVGGGALENFAELNRQRAIGGVADFVAYGCNPQVHASDEATLFESLAVQGRTVAMARRIACGRAVCVSPVTLTRRWRKTDPGGAAVVGDAGLAPLRFDSRSGDPLAAAWTLGSLAALSAAGADSVTLHEATGDGGFVSASGELRPPATALQAIRGRARATDLRAVSSDPASVACIAFRRGPVAVVALANLRPAPIAVELHHEARRHLVALAPYQVLTCPVDPAASPPDGR